MFCVANCFSKHQNSYLTPNKSEPEESGLKQKKQKKDNPYCSVGLIIQPGGAGNYLLMPRLS